MMVLGVQEFSDGPINDFAASVPTISANAALTSRMRPNTSVTHMAMSARAKQSSAVGTFGPPGTGCNSTGATDVISQSWALHLNNV